MKRPALLLGCLLMAPGAAQADEAWPRAWTVNVSGHWSITGCPQAPDLPRALEVRQAGHRLTQAAGPSPTLNGAVYGHDVSFTVSRAGALNCLPSAAGVRFDGTADGARIVGTLRSADDANRHATVTIQLRREFMLSFDDGPLPGRTDRVLDMLRHLRADDGRPVRAAFFTVGDAPRMFWNRRAYYAPYEIWSRKGSTAAYPALVARILAEGHVLGNHTAHHAWFRWPRFQDESAVAQEIQGWEAVTPQAAGQPKWLRPPYLIATAPVLAAARDRGYRVVLGATVGDAAPGSNVDSVEWKALQILETRDGSAPALLIFHDILPTTYTHLLDIVRRLRDRGYTLTHFDAQRLDEQTLVGGSGPNQSRQAR